MVIISEWPPWPGVSFLLKYFFLIDIQNVIGGIRTPITRMEYQHSNHCATKDMLDTLGQNCVEKTPYYSNIIEDSTVHIIIL